MTNLSDKKCVPCEGGVAPFGDAEIASYLSQLKPGWQVVGGKPGSENATAPPKAGENTGGSRISTTGKKIKKEFKFKSFAEAMSFVNKIAELAEAEGHHPDISIIYNRVVIELWTHAIGGLSENDFIVAAKIEAL